MDLDELWTAIALEATYQGVLAKGIARGLPPIERTAFWLMLAAHLNGGPSPQAIANLLSIGPEVERMMALSFAVHSRTNG
jgi:hypothetical protein